MLTFFNLILLITVLGSLIVTYFFLKNHFEKKLVEKIKNEDIQNFLVLNQKITEIFQTLEQGLLERFKNLSQEIAYRYEESLKKQEKFIETSSKLEELARNLELSVMETKEIKSALLGPKTRGYFGEIMLEEILSQLPSSLYEKQYKLGFDYVDYVLKINGVLIPIDSKFPYEKFKKENLTEEERNRFKRELKNNLKEKILTISRKYIQPYKGTVEFVIMYLANEGIYYELLSDKDYDEIWELARENSVVLTSPKIFEILISSLLLALRKQELAKNLDFILQNLNQLEKDLRSLEDSFEKSFNQLQNSFKNFTETSRILIKLSYNLKNILKNKDEAKIKERSLV